MKDLKKLVTCKSSLVSLLTSARILADDLSDFIDYTDFTDLKSLEERISGFNRMKSLFFEDFQEVCKNFDFELNFTGTDFELVDCPDD